MHLGNKPLGNKPLGNVPLLFHVVISVASEMKNDANNQEMPKEMIAKIGDAQ